MSVYTIALVNQNGSLNYSWEKDGEPIGDDPTAEAGDELTFTFNAPQVHSGINKISITGQDPIQKTVLLPANVLPGPGGTVTYVYSQGELMGVEGQDTKYTFTVSVNGMRTDPQMIVKDPLSSVPAGPSRAHQANEGSR